MIDFRVGDKVVHSIYGLGEILEMDVKFIHNREMLCYVVKAQNLTIWVAADDPENVSLRQPTPEGDFEDLFTILQSEGEPLPQDRMDRKAELAVRMKDGKIASICSVIRDLFFYKRVKKLNDNDKSTLERAENILLAEWVCALSVPYLQAKNELNQLVGIA